MTPTTSSSASSPNGETDMNDIESLESRFWTRVDTTTTPDGCWLWTGSKRHTYGEILNAGKKLYTHRVSYMLAYGAIPAGAFVCHHCDVPLCVRPDHLFAGTQTDNMRDCATKGRMRGVFTSEQRRPRKTHCIHGHEFTDETSLWRVTSSGYRTRTCKICSDASKRRYMAKRRNAA